MSGPEINNKHLQNIKKYLNSEAFGVNLFTCSRKGLNVTCSSGKMRNFLKKLYTMHLLHQTHLMSPLTMRQHILQSLYSNNLHEFIISRSKSNPCSSFLSYPLRGHVVGHNAGPG